MTDVTFNDKVNSVIGKNNVRDNTTGVSVHDFPTENTTQNMFRDQREH